MKPRFAGAAALIAATIAFCAIDGAVAAEAPFGDKVGASVTNYDRIAPTVGTGGLLREGAVDRLKALGFKTIVDLRAPEEGIQGEKASAEAAGLNYINLPITAQAPSQSQVEAFAGIVDDPRNWPVLVHCHTGNRVGAMWALYRVGKGVPFVTAIEEGRTVGLQETREKAVKARFAQ